MHEFDSTQAEQQTQLQCDPQLNSTGSEQEEENKIFDLADPAAIAANQHGELTSVQIDMFESARIRSSWWYLMVIPIFVIAIWIVFFQQPYNAIYFLLDVAAGAIITYLPSLLTYIRKLRLNPLLAEARIEQITGEVVKVGRKTLARGEGRRLKMVDKAYPLPLEGRYLFFVLASTDYLLSAQSRDGSEPGAMDLQAGERLLLGLSQANNFSLAELTLNREGRLSEGQRGRLFFSSVKSGIGCFLAFIGLIVTIYSFEAWDFAQFSWGAWAVVIFVSLLLLAVALINCFSCITLALEWRDGHVVQLESGVERILSANNNSSSPSASYYYTYEKFHHKVSKEAYRALVPGLRYRIYHTPRQHRLMSIEPLEDTLPQ